MLSTARLLLRDWTAADAPAALAIMSEREVVRWLGDGDPVLLHDLDEARARIAVWRDRDDAPLGHWALEVTDGGPLHGRVIGSVLLLRLPNGAGEVEIGWHLHPDAWGEGYAPEAARAILRRGFEAGLPEIHAVTHLDNERSMAVCRKLGMRDAGVVHQWYDGPSRHFVISRQDWATGTR